MAFQETIELKAESNLGSLAQPYPGRVIISGLMEDPRYAVQIGIVMGRSAGSRNRVLVQEDYYKAVRTEVFDPSLETGDTKNILYPMSSGFGPIHITSNGRQTEDYNAYIKPNLTLNEMEPTLLSTYEDDPSHTSRITTVLSALPPYNAKFIRVARSEFDSEGKFSPVYSIYHMPLLVPGYGYSMQTYTGEGGTEPSREEPMLIRLKGDAEEFTDTLWNLLDPENKVALLTRRIELNSHDFSTIFLKNSRLGD